MRAFTVVIEQDEDGMYVASVPELMTTIFRRKHWMNLTGVLKRPLCFIFKLYPTKNRMLILIQ